MTKRIVKGVDVETGSGNVFADLDLPDADNLKIKSGLAIDVASIGSGAAGSGVRRAARAGHRCCRSSGVKLTWKSWLKSLPNEDTHLNCQPVRR